MNRADSNIVTFNFPMHWLSVPPAVAVFTILTAGLFPSGPAIPVDPAIWGLVVLMFVLLTVLYGIFIKQQFIRGLFPVQLIAQGLLLCPLSLRMGAPAFSWIGVLLAICGAVVLVALYHRAHHDQQSARYMTPQPELDALPLPFVITDSAGHVTSASDFLLQLLQKPRSAVNGEKIDTILPFDKETITIGGREWRILQTPMDDGTHYFQLEESRDVTVTVPTSSDNDFIDSDTSLYNRSYAIRRVEEELYRVHRYKRWMSAALLRVDFQANEASSAYSAKKEDDVFNAYCRFIRASIRETDISCLVGLRDILVVMPETELDGAQDVMGKLLDITVHLKEETQQIGGAVEVHGGIAFFNASSEPIDFDRVLEKLDESMK